jgi:oligopeptide/dipeptide ABC transporter ATP-binding protein
MEQKQTILNAKNVKVSFKTPAGRVHAVRGIDFDLYKGETLAIVGESGSGKSVTSKAILGILADNADIESGEIIFDGQDLLRIGEKEFGDIRGEKISMIFQDPLSSLNPIVKIGKQMTESVIIKGEQKQYNAKKEMAQKLKDLAKYMTGEDGATAMLSKFGTFVKAQYKLENSYHFSRSEVEYCVEDVKKLLIRVGANAFEYVVRDLKRIERQAKLTFNNYLVKNKQSEVLTLISELLASVNKGKIEDTKSAISKLERLQVIFEKTLKRAIPNFFAMAYYNCYAGQPLPEMDTKDLNIFLQDYLDKEFLNAFKQSVKNALIKSHNETIANKQIFVDRIDQLLSDITDTNHGRKLTLVTIKQVTELVENCIDKLSNRRDSYTYAFRDSFRHAFDHYYTSNKSNKKEQSRYDKEKSKIDAKGKDYEPKPAGLIDLNDILINIKTIAHRVKDNFKRDIEYGKSRNFEMATDYMLTHIKDLAKLQAHKVTREMAKRLAIRLMEEVGITNAETRFDQYPFEFSGGMRQRIVIAIALSADPQILVCDEPTTALDVTIQSQILELINNLKVKRGLSVIFITHDLGVVANMADRVAVMYAGKIVEYGTKQDIFYNPRHPYTWALLSSMPDMDTQGKLDAIPGTPPNMIYPPKGDAFAARNKYAMKIDFEEQPPMFKISEHHFAATWLLHPSAPSVDIPQVIRDRIKRNQSKYGASETMSHNHVVTVVNGMITGAGVAQDIAKLTIETVQHIEPSTLDIAATQDVHNIGLEMNIVDQVVDAQDQKNIQLDARDLVDVDNSVSLQEDTVADDDHTVEKSVADSIVVNELANSIVSSIVDNSEASVPLVDNNDTAFEDMQLVETQVEDTSDANAVAIGETDDTSEPDVKQDEDMLIATDDAPKHNPNKPKLNIGDIKSKKGSSSRNSFFKNKK